MFSHDEQKSRLIQLRDYKEDYVTYVEILEKLNTMTQSSTNEDIRNLVEAKIRTLTITIKNLKEEIDNEH